MYKYWKELFRLLRENNLGETLISTKVPIDEETVVALKEFDLRVQISLDAIDSGRLQKILSVGSSVEGSSGSSFPSTLTVLTTIAHVLQSVPVNLISICPSVTSAATSPIV